ncbi:hypothetical protein [Thiomonas sp.]
MIGEAARRIRAPTRQAHPEIPWKLIIGLRISWRMKTDASIMCSSTASRQRSRQTWWPSSDRSSPRAQK